MNKIKFLEEVVSNATNSLVELTKDQAAEFSRQLMQARADMRKAKADALRAQRSPAAKKEARIALKRKLRLPAVNEPSGSVSIMQGNQTPSQQGWSAGGGGAEVPRFHSGLARQEPHETGTPEFKQQSFADRAKETHKLGTPARKATLTGLKKTYKDNPDRGWSDYFHFKRDELEGSAKSLRAAERRHRETPSDQTSADVQSNRWVKGQNIRMARAVKSALVARETPQEPETPFVPVAQPKEEPHEEPKIRKSKRVTKKRSKK